MKRIVTLLLTLATLISMTGCRKYEPQKSTKLESTKVAAMQYGGKKYEANYELFRMLLLSAKETVSNNDPSRFEGAEGDALLEKAREIALDKMYEIYSVFALCEELGIKLYSRKVNKAVEESITVSIEGGFGADGQQITGLGSYEKYLENLSLYYMNYAVQDLMLRYSYGVSAIGTYFRGTTDAYGNPNRDGKLTYTADDITAYYNREDTRRIFLVFTTLGEFRASELRGEIASKDTDEAVSTYILGHTTASEADAKDGLVIGKYSLDSSVYSAVTEAAFALEEGETSMPIEGLYGGESGHFILYRAKKSAENLAANRESVANYFIENEIGKRFEKAKSDLEGSAVFTDFYKGLVLKDISMDEEEK